MSLRQITLGSAAMSSVGIFRMLAQFFIIPALARYLSPADYGVIAIAMPFVLFAMMFSDAGISTSLVRTSSKNAEEWSTSFWLTIGLGSFLALIICILGFIISVFLAEPVLFPIISALSLTIILQSLATVPGAELQQAHKFSTVALIDIISTSISLGATYISAANGFGAWALVVQQVVYYLIKLIFTAASSQFRPHLLFKLAAIKEHLIFGRDMVGNNFVGFIRQSITNMIMGKMLGTFQVGIFSMASQFSDLPNRLVSGPLQMILYMRLSALKDNKQAVKTLYIFITRVVAILVVPLIGMLAIAHSPVFTIILSEKWAYAGHIFLLLAPAAAIQTVSSLRNTIAMALGRTEILVRQSIETGIIAILALLVFVSFGLEWVVISGVVLSVLYAPRALIQILPLIDISLKQYMVTIAVPFLTTAASILAYLAATETSGFSDWLKFGIAVLLGMAALGSAAIIQIKTLKTEAAYLRENMPKAGH